MFEARPLVAEAIERARYAGARRWSRDCEVAARGGVGAREQRLWIAVLRWRIANQVPTA
jgi:hypothetical protein